MSFFPLHSGWGHGYGHGQGIVNNLVVHVNEREHYRHRYYDDNWCPWNRWDGRGQGQGNGGNGQGNGGQGQGNGGGRD